MSSRRARGDGGLHWDEKRQRWIATATTGYDGRGKRLVKRASGRTKTEARDKLRVIMRDVANGLAVAGSGVTVEWAVRDWLAFGLVNRSPRTLELNRYLCETHVIPALGARKVQALTPAHVESWLQSLSVDLSRRTIQIARACLSRAIRRAMQRDLVGRNVVELTEVPAGRPGRVSKAFTAQLADAVLTQTAGDRFHAYIVVSMLTGARTEELRALRWEHVCLDADPPFMEVWRSVRAGGDTKTRRSRRTIALPGRCVEALTLEADRQARDRQLAGPDWKESGLVFTSLVGTGMDAANVRRYFRRALALVEGVQASEWTPRELRHSFVSLLSDAGVPIEEIARLVGHSGTTVTELVYRHQLRPVIQTGATVMDRLFGSAAVQARSHAVGHAVGVVDELAVAGAAMITAPTRENGRWSQGDSNP